MLLFLGHDGTRTSHLASCRATRRSVMALVLAACVAYGCGGLLGGDAAGAVSSVGGAAVSGAGSSAGGGASTGGSGANLCATGGQSSASNAPGYCSALLTGADCGHIQYAADVRDVNMLLVVDASLQMNNRAHPTDSYTRWDLATRSLGDTLPIYASDMNFGLELFPDVEAGAPVSTSDVRFACHVTAGAGAIKTDVAVGVSNLVTVMNSLRDVVPSGESPLTNALDRAYEYYTSGAGRCLTGSKWIMLVTPGIANCNVTLSCGAADCVPNIEPGCSTESAEGSCCDKAGYLCADSAAVTAKLSQLSAAGVKTLVIGMPANDYETGNLVKWANAGQAQNPVSSDSVPFYWLGEGKRGMTDLESQLQSMITQLIRTCDLPFDRAPLDASKIQVATDCMLIPQVEPPGDGFHLDTSQNPPHLVFTGAVCNSINTLGALYVDILYDCLN